LFIYFSGLQESDSTGRKLSGSLINALIFIGIIGAMTFLLVLMFKYGVRTEDRKRPPINLQPSFTALVRILLLS
jgi:hypothetical protein